MSDKVYHKATVFSAACIGMLLFGIVMISMGSILPEVTEKFNLNEAETGFLITLLPLGILTGSLVFGPMVDWLSYKRILIAGSIFTLVGMEGIVYSQNLVLLQLSVFCIGLGGGILNGLTNALVSEISETDHSANLSLLGVFFGIGALGTPVILGLFSGVYSFETIFAFLGALIVLPIIFFLLINFPKSSETMGTPFRDGMRMAKDPLLLTFGFILFFQSGIEGLTNNWTTTYLEAVKEIEGSKALFILSSFVGAITVGRIVLGKILRIFNPLKIMVIGFILALGGCLTLITSVTYFAMIVGMVAVGLGIAAGFPVILGYVGQIYTRLSGTAFSIVITIALIGNVILNYLMGQISQQYGTRVLSYLIVIAILAILILLGITKKKYHTKIN